VLEVRDLWPAFAIAVGVLRSRLLIALSEWLERFLYRRADRIVINSPGFSAHINQRGGPDLRLVPNGADASMFDPAATGAQFRRQHGLQDKFIVLYAGAHGLSNDLGVVLDAAALLKVETNIALVLVGDGKDKPTLQTAAAQRGLSNLHFVPPLPKLQMAEALAAADVCLAILKPLPLYATVYPNKVFDYMAAGRPILLAIDGVVRQVVEQAGAGRFTPPGDAAALAAAVRSFAADPANGRRMGAAGRAYLAANFDRQNLARLMEAALLDK
jgi:glycosyltransferase involved in cell wall biosynthesis